MGLVSRMVGVFKHHGSSATVAVPIAERQVPWLEMVRQLQKNHNGIMSIELHFGHDGDSTCRFRDYDRVLAECSCDDMQRSVDTCHRLWLSGVRSFRR